MRIQSLIALSATFTILAACATGDDPNSSFNTFNDDGIDSSNLDDTETGDGDGDGDPTTTTSGDGDGDGDPTTTGDGDGDGDPTTTGDGDGDGDPTTTGDGDGDVPVADMIDNFEDGDGALLANGGRQGYWYTYNDGLGTQSPPANMVLPQAGGAAGTGKAMRTSGSGFSTWGAGIGVDLNNAGDGMGGNGIKMVWNASAYSGIVLMAKGSGQVWVAVQTSATVPVAEGGTCAIDCDPHGKMIVLSNQWQQYTLPFNQLAQEGWGTPAAWDASTAAGIQFKVGANANFDFWIDEVGFY